MVDVRAGDAETAVVGDGATAEAAAGGIDGGEVGGEGGVAEVEISAGGDCVAETLVGCFISFFLGRGGEREACGWLMITKGSRE